MSSEASCHDILLGTPTRSSTSSSDAEAAVSFESESSKQGSSEACPSESALTPTVVANPAQLVPAAETPSGEELSLTLQAYPHLRNTRVAKGWRPPPVISATPVLSVHLTTVHALAASRRAAQPMAHGCCDDQPTAAAHPLHGNGGLPPCRTAARSATQGFLCFPRRDRGDRNS